MENLFDDNGAQFSSCGKYRYCLWRIWDEALPKTMFIGLNPSTANESQNDPTIRRVIGFATDWGFGGVYMMNCFPYISTDPNALKDFGNTAYNDRKLYLIGEQCEQIIFAWGAFSIVKELGRDEELKGMFPSAKALIINQNGTPRHPLYVPANTKPIDYRL